MTVLVNAALDPARVPAPSLEALPFHRSLPGYAPTPLLELPWLAKAAGVDAVLLKDESNRLGLPAFKVLGASWAIERTLRGEREVQELIAASAGNHGRAVARVAAERGLRCRIFLPGGAAPARREAIEAEGAEVVAVDGGYEEAVARAAAAGREPGSVEIADVGASSQASWVIDGYATLFAEASEQGDFDLILVPVGVGSLAAAAARHGASAGVRVVGVEPATAACLAASLARGRPATVDTPGTTMAGLDCAHVSPAAWPSLEAGIAGSITVTDAEAHAEMRALAAEGLAIGDCGAAPAAALRRLADDPVASELREAIGFRPGTRVLLVATEGPTDPAGYARVTASAAP
jgi:diaminopropionate ammonia-lyase